jgi:hypothetical protein
MNPAASVRRAGPLLLPAATVGAVVMAVLLARHAVFLAPLNVDEELTIRLGEFSFRHILHIVSTQRGGGPLHFWLEHFLLGWWPSLQALRLPSLVFFCLALPAVALIVRPGWCCWSRRRRCPSRTPPSDGRTRCSSPG